MFQNLPDLFNQAGCSWKISINETLFSNQLNQLLYLREAILFSRILYANVGDILDLSVFQIN